MFSSWTTESFVLTVVITTYFFISFLQLIFKKKMYTRHIYTNHSRRKQIYVYITALSILFLINVLQTFKFFKIVKFIPYSCHMTGRQIQIGQSREDIRWHYSHIFISHKLLVFGRFVVAAPLVIIYVGLVLYHTIS